MTKKNVKVYSASDFASANQSVVINNCYWRIDSVDYTKEGQYSNTPLFELELKQVVTGATDVPEGLEDGSADMVPNRTYFVREGRPLYNQLLAIWQDSDNDKEDFISYVMGKYANKAYRGRVERLSGVNYSKDTKHGTIVQKCTMEAWYPEAYDEGRILDDFIYLCNRGVYKPIIEEKPTVDPATALANIDPATLKALLAALKK